MFDVVGTSADPQMLRTLQGCIEQRGHRPLLAPTGDEALRVHREWGADLVVASLPLPDLTGADLLRRLRAQDPRVLILVHGRDASIASSAAAIDAGALDHLPDPFDRNALLAAIGVALGARRTDMQLRYLRRKDASGVGWDQLIGTSPSMRDVFSTVRRICHRTTSAAAPTILLSGETGTGKGLLAKAIHYNGPRRGQTFVEVTCPSIPDTLIEDELFGHERGAFTDARAVRQGLAETASGGTLFLDEIACVPRAVQAKLLRLIDERLVRRLGSNRDSAVDVQIVAATNRDLATMVRSGEFAEDLFHRLSVVTIELPPLRERGPDRQLLAERFIEELSQRYGQAPRRLGPDALALLEEYPWPGNVRELRNQLEQIVLTRDGELVAADQFTVRRGSRVEVRAPANGASAAAPEVVVPREPFELEAVEREILRAVLAMNGGNVSASARHLGITRQTLMYRIDKYGLAEPV